MFTCTFIAFDNVYEIVAFASLSPYTSVVDTSTTRYMSTGNTADALFVTAGNIASLLSTVNIYVPGVTIRPWSSRPSHDSVFICCATCVTPSSGVKYFTGTPAAFSTRATTVESRTTEYLKINGSNPYAVGLDPTVE